MAKLVRKDTVLMDEVVSKQGSKEIVDFVYNVSHIWSQRHPERAAEVIDEQIIFMGRSKEPIKGKEAIVKWLFSVHDSVEDFHYTIASVHHEGDLNKGTIFVEWIGGGESSKQFGDHKTGISKPFKIYGMSMYKVVNKKVVEGKSYTDMANTTPELLAMLNTVHA